MYCGDSGISNGIIMSAVSICEHTNEQIDFYILTADYKDYSPIGPEFAKKLESLIGNNCHVKLYNIGNLFNGYLPTANLSTRFTPMCMLRLFADLIEDIPEKVLYLDADVLCRKNISDFYNTDISDFDFLGVPDRYGKWFFGNIFRHDYLNSGVLLLNLKRIKENGLFSKCRMLCRDKKMFMPDQTALNKLAKKKKIPVKYNEQGRIKSDTVFKHFTTYFVFFPYFKPVTIKPWNEELLHSKLKIYEFDEVIKKSKEI